MNSISCTSLCVAAILLQCLLYVEAKPSIKAKKMKAFDLRKFKTFKKISIKPFPALQTRSSNGIHPNHISLNKLDGLKSSSDRLVSANHFVSNKTALKHSDKQKDQVKNYESNVAISSGNESGDNDLENENESGDNDFENENENLKKSTKNLVENYSEPKNVFLNNFYNAVENSKTKGKNEITNIIETKFLQPRALPTTYNTNLTIENSVHSYATFKSNIHLKPSSSIQQRGILSNVLKNANFSIQNSVHTYTVKKSNSKPNKKEELVRLDPVDVVGVKRDNDPIEKRNNYPVERERNFMLKGKSPSDVAAEIEMNDKALIPLLSNASPKELRIDSETPNEETQGHISRGKYGLPFEGSHESNYGKRDSRRHDGNHEDHEATDDNANEDSHYNKEGRYYPDSDEEYRKKDSKENFYDNPRTRGDAHDFHEPSSSNRDRYNNNQEEEHFPNDSSYHRENNDHDDDDHDHQKKYDDDSYSEKKRDHDYRDSDYKEKDYHDNSEKSFHNKKPKNSYYDDKCDDKEKRNSICRNSGR